MRPKEDEKPVGRGDSTWFYSSQFGLLADTFKVDFLGTMKIRVEGAEYTVLKESGAYVVDSSDITSLSWDGPEGWYAMGIFDAFDTLYTKLLKYKYPARVGETYEFRNIAYALDYSFVVSSQVLTMKVVAVDTLIHTSAGTFLCNQYQYSKRPSDDVLDIWQHNIYYAPHIGLIGEKVFSSGGGILQNYFLIKREQNH